MSRHICPHWDSNIFKILALPVQNNVKQHLLFKSDSYFNNNNNNNSSMQPTLVRHPRYPRYPCQHEQHATSQIQNILSRYSEINRFKTNKDFLSKNNKNTLKRQVKKATTSMRKLFASLDIHYSNRNKMNRNKETLNVSSQLNEVRDLL